MVSAGLSRALDVIRHLSDPNPPWEEAVRCALEVIGGDSASFILLDGNSDFVAIEQCHISEAAVKAYEDHYYACDIAAQMALGAKEGSWIVTSELLRPTQLHKSEFYDFMCQHHMREFLTFVVEESSCRRGGLTIQRDTPLSNARSLVQSEPVQIISRAIQDAVRSRRSEAQRFLDLTTNTFQALGEATALLSANGSVVFQSNESLRLMWERASLSKRSGRLWHASPEIRGLLEGAISKAVAAAGSARVSIPGSHGGACILDLVRADPTLSLCSEALVFGRLRVNERAHQAVSGALRLKYGLTPTEERLLAELVAGHSATRCAQTHGTSINTVRKQISQLMDKFECNRQVDLVRKALS